MERNLEILEEQIVEASSQGNIKVTLLNSHSKISHRSSNYPAT